MAENIQINYDQLALYAQSILLTGENLGDNIAEEDIDSDSNIVANSLAHDAIDIEITQKTIMENMIVQESKNINGIGTDYEGMEESVKTYFDEALSNT